MKKQMNCPNCGAPMKGSRCEYCGTEFGEKTEDLGILQVAEGVIEIHGVQFRVRVDEIEASSGALMTVRLTGVELSKCRKSPPMFYADEMLFCV